MPWPTHRGQYSPTERNHWTTGPLAARTAQLDSPASHPAAVVVAILAPINEGILFRAEAVLALLAALALIRAPSRLASLLTFAVSASALALMVVSRYADIGSFDPFP